MVSQIKFSFVEDGKTFGEVLKSTDVEDKELDYFADILTGMWIMGNNHKSYESAKKMVIENCKKLISSL